MLSAAQKNNKVIAVYREPFSLGSPTVEAWEPGQNIRQIVARMRCIPDDFELAGGVVMVNGKEVPAARWQYVKPKAHRPDKPVAVTFHMPVKGGGGGFKRIFALVAALALSVLTAGIAALGIPALGIVGGTLTAKLVAAGIGLVGSLAINALTAQPVRNNTAATNDATGGGTQLDPASISGNMLQQNAPIPRVIGTREIYPPFLVEPLVEIIGQDEFVHAIYGLAGAHAGSDFRLGRAAIDIENESEADLEIKYFDGLPESEPIIYPQRYSRTFQYGTELSVHGTAPTDQSQYAGPLPVWHSMSTTDAPNEVWLHLLCSGLIRQPTQDEPDEDKKYLRVPIRVRMRLRGETDWRYLPELHYIDKTQSQRRLQIKFFFDKAFPGAILPAIPTGRGWTEARKLVPAQIPDEVGTIWECDPYFSKGAGNDIYRVGTNETTNVANIRLSPDIVGVYLDRAEWPDGVYDIEIKRGAVIKDEKYTSNTYVVAGSQGSTVYDLFGSQSSQTMVFTREGILDRFNITRLVNVRNEPPIDQKNLTLVYVVARNRTVDNLSFVASGYTRDWDGTGWNTLVTGGQHIVAHYRDILSGSLNYDPLPDDLHDNETLLEWRQRCIDNGYQCNLVCENATVSETLRIVSACGYATPYQSELYGVVQDYDRSAETPVQIFSPRNMNNFRWRKAFANMPSGLRVNFKDDAYQYTGKQIVVYRAGASATDERTEQVSYEGLVTRAEVTKRAKFDLLQAQYRSTIYTWVAAIENLVCRRGSLVGVTHDITQSHYASGRIEAVDVDEMGNVAGIVLDNAITVKNIPDVLLTADILQVDNVLELGMQTSIAIRRTNGIVTDHPLSNATGETDTLTFETPVPDMDGVQSALDLNVPKQIDYGCLVVVGRRGTVYKRLLISSIMPGKDFTADISALDEAPEIHLEAA